MTTESAAERRPLVTVIVPVLQDTIALASALQWLPPDPAVEIVVVDGAPDVHDPLLAALRAERRDVIWSSGAAGRGAQMNAGARLATGRWLLFLHADTHLGEGWLNALRSVDAGGESVGGSFAFRLDARARWARSIERAVAWRVRLAGLPHGDQALFVRREIFDEMRGYRELPLMEDVDFVRRLRRRGRLVHLAVPAVTSARRWERDGWLRRSLRNVVLITLYFAGTDPVRLACWYHRGTSRTSR